MKIYIKFPENCLATDIQPSIIWKNLLSDEERHALGIICNIEADMVEYGKTNNIHLVTIEKTDKYLILDINDELIDHSKENATGN